MKIKVLAAMMALASTGVMAVGAEGNVNSMGFKATGVIAETCILENADAQNATLGFGAKAGESTFTLSTNNPLGATFSVASGTTNVLKLDGTSANSDIRFSGNAQTGVDAIAEQQITLDNGSGGFTVAAYMSGEATTYLATNDATVTATVTVSCAGKPTAE